MPSNKQNILHNKSKLQIQGHFYQFYNNISKFIFFTIYLENIVFQDQISGVGTQYTGFVKKCLKIDQIYCTTNQNGKNREILNNVISIEVSDLTIYLENLKFRVEISGAGTL